MPFLYSDCGLLSYLEILLPVIKVYLGNALLKEPFSSCPFAFFCYGSKRLCKVHQYLIGLVACCLARSGYHAFYGFWMHPETSRNLRKTLAVRSGSGSLPERSYIMKKLCEMELLKWALRFLLLTAGICEIDSPSTCKPSTEVATVGESYTLSLYHFQYTENSRPMLTKDDKEFYRWYGDKHELVYKAPAEDLERLRKRISASTLKEKNPLRLTLSPVEAEDQGLYCLEHVKTCFQCVNLEVQKRSTSDKINEDNTHKNRASIAAVPLENRRTNTKMKLK